MRKILFAAIVLAASQAAPADAHSPSTIYIHESYQGVTDISPPTILTVIMHRKGGHKAARSRCADMGGTYTARKRQCVNVDY